MLRQYQACFAALVVILCCLLPATARQQAFFNVQDKVEAYSQDIENDVHRNLLQLGDIIGGFFSPPDDSAEQDAIPPTAAPVAAVPVVAPAPVVPVAPAPVVVAPPPVETPVPAPTAVAPVAPIAVAPAPVVVAPAPVAPAPVAPAPVEIPVPAPAPIAPDPVPIVPAPSPVPIPVAAPEPVTVPEPVAAPPPVAPPARNPPVLLPPAVEPDDPPETPPETPSSTNDGETGGAAAGQGEESPDDEEGGLSKGIIVAIVVGVLVVLVVAIVAVLFGGRGCGSSAPPPPPPVVDTPPYYGGNTADMYGASAAQGTKYFVPAAAGATAQQYSNVGVGYAPPVGYGPEEIQAGYQNGAHGGYQKGAQGGYQNGAHGGYENGAQGGYHNGAQGEQVFHNGAHGGAAPGYQKAQPLPPDHPANPMFDHQYRKDAQQLSPRLSGGGAVGAAAVGANSWQGQQEPLGHARTNSYDALANAAAPAMAAAAVGAQISSRRRASSKPSRASSYTSAASPDGHVASAGGSTPPGRRNAGAEEEYVVEESAYFPYSDPANDSSTHQQSLFFMNGGPQADQQAPAVRREEAQDFLHQHDAKHVTVVPGEATAGEAGAQTLVKTLSKSSRNAGYIPEGPGYALVQQLDWIEEHKKGLLLGKYKLQGAAQRRSGGQGMVAFASDPYNNAVYAVKFYFSASSFQREKSAITHPGLERAMPACVDIVDSEQERRLPSPQGILPLMIVTEKGECLSEYMKRKHPDYVTSMQVIVQIAEKLRTMHYAGWAHRDLKPGNTIWLPSRNTWSLIDFGCAGRIGSKVPISFTLRYAAPETVSAFQRGKSTSSADTAVDVFAFGIMCYELLTRAPYYPDGMNGQEVGEMLAGNKHLPHETMSDTNARRLGVLRETVLKMLDRDPVHRISISDLLKVCSNVFQINNNSTTQG